MPRRHNRKITIHYTHYEHFNTETEREREGGGGELRLSGKGSGVEEDIVKIMQTSSHNKIYSASLLESIILAILNHKWKLFSYNVLAISDSIFVKSL